MRPDFFPGPVFGWIFYGVLVLLLAISSVIDLRTFRIPKKLSVTCAALGITFNMARGIWLGLLEKPVWKLPVGPWYGLIDGIMFALAGFATGFAIFFCLWFLKAAGGGDVKLFTAVGCWVGPWHMVLLLVVSAIMLVVISIAWMLGSTIRFGFAKTRKEFSHKETQKRNQGRKPSKHWRLTYSLPLAISTAIVMLLVLGKDLGLVSEVPAPVPLTQVK